MYNNYLVPYATMELGLLYLEHNRLEEAKLFLLRSRYILQYIPSRVLKTVGQSGPQFWKFGIRTLNFNKFFGMFLTGVYLGVKIPAVLFRAFCTVLSC